jgi:pyruvate kinase
MMSRIVIEAEHNMASFSEPRRRRTRHPLSVAEAICESIAHAAEDLPMGAIAIFTESGNTARMISKFRPRVSIYAFSHTGPVCNRLNLFWGVHPVQRRELSRTAEDMVNTAERELLHRGQLKPGDVLGVVAGTQMASGSTNFMRLHTVPAPEIARAGRQRMRKRPKTAAKKRAAKK